MNAKADLNPVPVDTHVLQRCCYLSSNCIYKEQNKAYQKEAKNRDGGNQRLPVLV